MKKNSKFSVLFVVVALIVSMFGGVIFADTANSTIELSELEADVNFVYMAGRADIRAAMKAEKPNLSDSELELLLSAAGFGVDKKAPIEVEGTVVYSAEDQTLTFDGTGTIKVSDTTVTVSKTKVLPVNDVEVTLSIDGEEYAAQYDAESGVITCDYSFPANKQNVKISIADFVADTTYNDSEAQVVFNSEAATAEFKVNGETRYALDEIEFTDIDAIATINGTELAIDSSALLDDGSITLTYSMCPPTGLDGFIKRLYSMILDREAEEDGIDFWKEAVKLGATGGDIARAFLCAPEFLEADLSDEEFVEILYNVFFDRASEEDGIAFWCSALENGVSKEDVITGFINSIEWANVCLTYGIASGADTAADITLTPNQSVIDFATRLYTTCLGRDGEEAGVEYWSTALANRQVTGSEAAAVFFFGPEFTEANYEDEEFVSRLYTTFMDREASEDEIATWVDVLTAGASREDVFTGFAISPEFGDICTSYGINR